MTKLRKQKIKKYTLQCQVDFVCQRLPLEIPISGKTIKLNYCEGQVYNYQQKSNMYKFVSSLNKTYFMNTNGNPAGLKDQDLWLENRNGVWFRDNQQLLQDEEIFYIPWDLVVAMAQNPKPMVIWLTRLPLFIQHPLCETRLLSIVQFYIC